MDPGSAAHHAEEWRGSRSIRGTIAAHGPLPVGQNTHARDARLAQFARRANVPQ